MTGLVCGPINKEEDETETDTDRDCSTMGEQFSRGNSNSSSVAGSANSAASATTDYTSNDNMIDKD